MAEHQDIGELERHEELLSKKEERLQTAHQRRMEQEPSKGGAQGSKSVGHGFGDFVAGIGEHKGMLAIVGLGIVAVIIVYYVIQNQNNGGANTANAGTGLNPAGGILPSDISAQLASINDSISNLGSGGNSATPIPPQPSPGTNMTNHPAGTEFVNINSGVTHYVATGNQSINQIAALLGIAASSIYRIPENIHAGIRGGSSTPAAGTNVVIPGSSLPTASWYEVTNSATGQNSLAGIAQLEGIQLTTINSLNPNLATYTGTLLPGTEVRFK